MTVRPANHAEQLPEIVRLSRQMVVDEAETLRAAVSDVSNAPQPGCPHELDHKAWSSDTGPQAAGRRKLLGLTQHQARLIFFNAYDHLVTLARALGSDGAMSVLAHASLSRVACEAAVRFAWILDSGVSSEERIMRGTVALLVSADQRLKGAMRLPPGRYDKCLRQAMIANCTAERDEARQLTTDAGLNLGWSGDRRKVARIELGSPKVTVRVQLEITDLMAELLPDSPT